VDFNEARDNGLAVASVQIALCCKQITMPATHHSNFLQPNALPDAQQTVSMC